MKIVFTIILLLMLMACVQEGDEDIVMILPETFDYFPPLNSDEWVRINPYELGLNISEINNLKTYLESNKNQSIFIRYICQLHMRIFRSKLLVH